MRLLVLVLLFAVVAPHSYGQSSSDLVGAWLWLSTENADGSVTNPGTVGYSRQLQFSSDMAFHEFRNGTLFSAGAWGVSYVWVEINGGLVHVMLVDTTLGDRWEPLSVIPEAILQLRNAAGGTEEFVYTGTVSSASATWGGVKARYHR